ncbi:MAG: hypothetical protein H7Y00_16110 [Fimbriimonadaceae bacterium]|nr:hypothetical protein [Chitinophagales bacterium]
MGILFLTGTKISAQYISIYGINTSRILIDNTTFDADFFSASGGEISYSNYFLFGFNYNLGVEYLLPDDANLFLLKTGISRIYLMPSSFNHAKNKESVTYITNNWLASLDLNFYNGVLQQVSTSNYVFAVEPAWNLAYALGKKKKFYIGGEIAVRYTLFPNDVYDFKSEISIPFKLGVKYEL